MCRLSKLSARWMGELGFSIGITDIHSADVLSAQVHGDYRGNVECGTFIQAFSRAKLDLTAATVRPSRCARSPVLRSHQIVVLLSILGAIR
jgi:hypothetical protein